MKLSTFLLACGVGSTLGTVANLLHTEPPPPTLRTNVLVLSSTNGYVEFITKDSKATLLQHAITNGEICAIVGHQWQPYRGLLPEDGSLVYINPPPPRRVLRECSLCKRTERQFVKWREEKP